MKLFLSIFSLGLAYLPSSLAAAPPILGGTPVLSSDFISHTVVALLSTNRRGQALCTASLVGPNLAITAAHCVSDPTGDDPAQFSLVFNSNIKTANSSQIRAVDQVEIPAEWNPRASGQADTSDVALLHFEGEMPVGYVYSDLLPFNHAFRTGDEAVLSGYGVSDAITSSGAGLLRRTTVVVKSPNFSPSEIEFDQSYGGGACHGDSGGPAYLLIGGHPYLFGITSRGGGDCNREVIYTKLAAYSEWFEAAVARMHLKIAGQSAIDGTPYAAIAAWTL